jgi:hypothetical protein
MTQTISRIYQLRADADAAATELRTTGFADDDINLVSPSETSDEEILAAIQRGGVVATYADAYLVGIKRGETLISVQAAFGCAALVTTILEKHRPVDTGLGDQGYEKKPQDPAAPLSSALGWTVLLHNPTPLSSWLRLPVLSAHRPAKSRPSALAGNAAPFSKASKLPVLTHRPAILSSLFGWKLLSNDPAPLSRLLGWRVLSSDPPK